MYMRRFMGTTTKNMWVNCSLNFGSVNVCEPSSGSLSCPERTQKKNQFNFTYMPLKMKQAKLKCKGETAAMAQRINNIKLKATH